MMVKMMMAAGLALIALTTSGCAYMDSDEEQRVEDEAGAVAGTPAGGSGATTTRTYAVTGFTGLVAAGSDKIEVTRGDTFAVSAVGSPEVLDRLIIRVKNGDLEIRRRSGTWSDNGIATIRVTMPTLDEVTV
ncbi:MAG: GIN domain-containing protein, partial [Sphingomonadaceae bacterium]